MRIRRAQGPVRVIGLIATSLVGLTSLTLGTSAIAVAATPSSAPRIVDAQSAADPGSAKAIAEKFGHAVSVDSLTTDTTEVTAASDGKLTLVASAVPVRTKVNSKWVPIDLDLSSTGGYIQPKAAAHPVQFSAGGSGPLARVQGADGKWVDEGSPFGALPAPTIDGSTVTYANVLPDVDMRLTATAVGMSEVLVVKNATAAANPSLSHVHFSVGGSALSADAAGNVRAGAGALRE